MKKRPTSEKIIFKNNDLSLFYPVTPINVKNLVSTDYTKRTNFNYCFIDFANLFSDSEKSDQSGEITNIRVLKPDLVVESYFKLIKDYANSDSENIGKPFALDVISSYKNIYVKLSEMFDIYNFDYVIVPLSGGGIVAKFLPIQEEKIIEIEAKRLPLRTGKGKFAFGMNVKNINNIDYKLSSDLDNKSIAILEVCVASGMTTIGFLADLYSRGVKPQNVSIIAAAVSKSGCRIVNEFAESIGIDVQFYAAKVFDKLADSYSTDQDALLYEDGSFVVKSPIHAYDTLTENKEVL